MVLSWLVGPSEALSKPGRKLPVRADGRTSNSEQTGKCEASSRSTRKWLQQTEQQTEGLKGEDGEGVD